jgi:SAM-dependent methyltransferase
VGHDEDDPYADALMYDLEYAEMIEDLHHYADKARRAGGTILELGCGTGRLTRHLARHGARVHGVDRAPDMLRRHRALLALEPPEVQARVTLEEADYRSWQPPATAFGAVLWPFNALHHCTGPDDVHAVLSAARRWIRDDGFFAMDCYLPDPTLYGRDPDGRYEYRDFTDPRTGEVMTSWEQGWWDPEAKVHHVLYTYRRADGREHRAHLRLRMFEREELLALVAGAGWRLARETSDFQGRPVTPGSLKWVATLAPS